MIFVVVGLGNISRSNKLELNLFSDVDKESCETGKWFAIQKDIRLKIARLGNKKYKQVFKKVTAPYRNTMRRKKLDDAIADEITIKVVARTVLLDWEGIEIDGEPVEYSVATAEKALTNEDFLTLVTDIAGDLESFKVLEDEDTTENL